MIVKETILNLINANIRNKLPKVVKSEHADVEEALLDSIFIPYEVKQLDCPMQFILDNFILEPGEQMGLGKNVMVGYAMCNGNNGTQDRRKKSAVGFDPTAYVEDWDYSEINNTIGSNDSILVEHSHYTVKMATEIQGNDGSLFDGSNYLRAERPLASRSWDSSSDPFDYELVTVPGTANGGVTNTQGVSGKGRNVPLSLVTLFVQRI